MPLGFTLQRFHKVNPTFDMPLLEQVVEYLHRFIPPESILLGHGIGAVVEAFGLQKGEDYAYVIDISDWFAVQLSPTLCQPFSLAHIVKLLMGDDVPDHDSGDRDPLLDAQYARMLYFSYKVIPALKPDYWPPSVATLSSLGISCFFFLFFVFFSFFTDNSLRSWLAGLRSNRQRLERNRWWPVVNRRRLPGN